MRLTQTTLEPGSDRGPSLSRVQSATVYHSAPSLASILTEPEAEGLGPKSAEVHISRRPSLLLGCAPVSTFAWNRLSREEKGNFSRRFHRHHKHFRFC